MKGVIVGKLHPDDLVPIITCSICDPATFRTPHQKIVMGRALIDTGATDVSIRQSHLEQLGLVSDAPPVETVNVGSTRASVPYRSIVLLTGVCLADSAKPYSFGLEQVRTFVATFDPAMDFIIGMNVLSWLEMSFSPDASFRIGLP